MKYISIYIFFSLIFFISCKNENVTETNCGDNVVDIGEECDGSDLNNQSCTDLGYGEGTLGCSVSCEFDFSQCGVGTCGNFEIDGDDECDKTNLNNETCESLGYYSGTLSCNQDCTFDLNKCMEGGYCGDGIVQQEFGEECDGEEIEGHVCYAEGYHDGVVLCNDDCTLDYSDCQSFGYCGDGIVQQEYDEECDGTNINEITCADLNLPDTYPTGNPSCLSSCHFDLDSCGMCNDGIIQPEYEECDGTALTTISCNEISSLPLNGNIQCNDDCTNSLKDCSLKFQQLDSGDLFSCGLDIEQNVWCWGNNSFGQLGNGTYLNSSVPAEVTMPSGVTFVQISAGASHVCGLNSTGDAWCWGRNNYGQIGDNTSASKSIPTPVAMPASIHFQSISSGYSHTCAIDTNNQIWCWGSNSRGEIGDGTYSNSPVPILSTDASEEYTDISSGNEYTCAIDTNHKVSCWGRNDFGQLGNGSAGGTFGYSNITIDSSKSFIKVETDSTHTCAMTNGGNETWCWGQGSAGSLGNGDIVDSATPVMVIMTPLVSDISISISIGCTVDTSGNIWCWGNGNTVPVLESTPSSISFVSVTLGSLHKCALDTVGNIWCWGGNNSDGQLGRGTAINGSTPGKISLPLNF